jgi:hypothetical protein
MTDLDTSTLSIIGDGLRPSNFDVRDLSEILVGIEDLVKSVHYESDADAKVCLELISEGSVRLRLVSTVVGLLANTLPVVAQAIESGETVKLPIEVRRSLLNLVGITKRRNVGIQLPSNSLAPVVLDAETEIVVPRPIKGPSEIVAKVFRAGGKTPKGMFEGPSGSFLFLDLSEDQAVLCGKNLYARMRLRGIGTWDSETNLLIDFKPETVSPIIEHERVEAISRLREIFSNIDMSILAEIREEGGIL